MFFVSSLPVSKTTPDTKKLLDHAWPQNESTFSSLVWLCFPICSHEVGNPGVGKSTLLNALIGEANFTAGESYTGSGVTTVLQEAQHDGITYMDTPGLNDYERRKQCAAEITAALKKSGLYFICFVLTTEEGIFFFIIEHFCSLFKGDYVLMTKQLSDLF